jgi:TolA-binding protein
LRFHGGKMKQLMALAVSLALTASAYAAGPAPHGTTPADKKATPQASSQVSETNVLQRLDEMQQALDAQQQQISHLKEQLQNRDAVIEQLQQATPAAATTSPAQSKTASTPDSPQRKDFSVAQTPIVSPESRTADSGTVATASLSSPFGAAAAASPAAADPPAKDEKLGPIATQDFKIGVTFFGDYSYYSSTGYGQQFMDTPTAQEGPGNDGFNTFEINRAYVTFLYTPNDHVALRITPDIYRNSDGSYAFRLKYGYVDFQKIFGNGAFKSTKLTFGQTQQPLTDWEEGLSGYRYTYLTPWNYVSLSSTWVGAKLHGPIESNGKEYLDYDIGVFNNASFHAVETNENKQFMVRGTVYPFGTTADRTGLGFTIFNDFGYKGALPSAAAQTSLDRLAAIAFYQTHNKADQIAFEYEWGHNAYGTSNLFNGAGAPPTTGTYAAFGTEATTVLTGDTHQQGFALFGHARLGSSKFAVFGLWQYFKPNTDFDYTAAGFTADPIDWERTVGGISYSVTKQFDVAVGDENFHWLHPQGITTGGDTNGIAIWTQFNY